MKTFWKNLFEYSHHCNQGLFKLFAENTDRASEKSVRLFNHIINAHQIWNGRIEGIPQAAGVWDVRPAGDLKDLDAANFRNTLEILDKISLTAVIHYTTSKGTPFSNTVGDILFHAVNHSTYHRGQIALEFRQAGIEPWGTDYIFYKRAVK